MMGQILEDVQPDSRFLNIGNLDVSSKLVLLYIDFWQQCGRNDTPTIGEIAVRTSLSTRTVQRRLMSLKRHGVIDESFNIDWCAAKKASYNPSCGAEHQETVFRRDGYQCVYCGSTEKLSLDHVIPQSKGGGHDSQQPALDC